MLKKNRLAVKIAGRDHGICVILGKKKDKLQVVGPSVRKRFVSPVHLEPLPEELDTSKLSEDEIIEKLKEKDAALKADKLDFLTMTSLKAKLGR